MAIKLRKILSDDNEGKPKPKLYFLVHKYFLKFYIIIIPILTTFFLNLTLQMEFLVARVYTISIVKEKSSHNISTKVVRASNSPQTTLIQEVTQAKQPIVKQNEEVILTIPIISLDQKKPDCANNTLLTPGGVANNDNCNPAPNVGESGTPRYVNSINGD